MAANDDGVSSANTIKNNNDVTVSSVFINNVDVDGKNADEQRCHYGCIINNLHKLLSYNKNHSICNREDEFDGEGANNTACNNRIENNRELYTKNLYNKQQRQHHSSRPFIDIGKVLIFIANALLIHCITSVEPLNNINHYTDYVSRHK